MKPDYSKWKEIKFANIAENISERVAPGETELSVYVGLEHLDPRSIHIKRFGTPSEVEGVKLKAYPGDIIFGKRRAYQRKAAVMKAPGICSAHAMVLRARSESILPELFPFFLHSDSFMRTAVKVSEGSLSPTIKWKVLAEQLFRLPPLKEQRTISDLLLSIDNAIERNTDLSKAISTALSILCDKILCKSDTKKSFPLRRLRECLREKPVYGAAASAKEYVTGTPRYVRITDIDDEGDLRDIDIVSADIQSHEPYKLEDGDFLFARTGNTVGKTYLYKSMDGPCIYAGYLIRFRLDKSILLPEFLHIFTHSSMYDNFIKSTVKIGAQPNINAEEYQDMRLPVPPINEQREIVKRVSEYQAAITRVKKVITVQQDIRAKITNAIFG